MTMSGLAAAGCLANDRAAAGGECSNQYSFATSRSVRTGELGLGGLVQLGTGTAKSRREATIYQI